MRKAVEVGLLAVLAAIVVAMRKDLVRYLRIRQM
jgi:hypothetical protein